MLQRLFILTSIYNLYLSNYYQNSWILRFCDCKIYNFKISLKKAKCEMNISFFNEKILILSWFLLWLLVIVNSINPIYWLYKLKIHEKNHLRNDSGLVLCILKKTCKLSDFIIEEIKNGLDRNNINQPQNVNHEIQQTSTV